MNISTSTVSTSYGSVMLQLGTVHKEEDEDWVLLMANWLTSVASMWEQAIIDKLRYLTRTAATYPISMQICEVPVGLAERVTPFEIFNDEFCVLRHWISTICAFHLYILLLLSPMMHLQSSQVWLSASASPLMLKIHNRIFLSTNWLQVGAIRPNRKSSVWCRNNGLVFLWM